VWVCRPFAHPTDGIIVNPDHQQRLPWYAGQTSCARLPWEAKRAAFDAHGFGRAIRRVPQRLFRVRVNQPHQCIQWHDIKRLVRLVFLSPSRCRRPGSQDITLAPLVAVGDDSFASKRNGVGSIFAPRSGGGGPGGGDWPRRWRSRRRQHERRREISTGGAGAVDAAGGGVVDDGRCRSGFTAGAAAGPGATAFGAVTDPGRRDARRTMIASTTSRTTRPGNHRAGGGELVF
jgi:hypothetical protein